LIILTYSGFFELED